MDTRLRIAFCLGLLAVAVLEGPRAGAFLAEAARGPYAAPFPFHSPVHAAEAAHHDDADGPPERRGARPEPAPRLGVARSSAGRRG